MLMILKQPLVHFMIIGLFMFGLYNKFAATTFNDDPKIIELNQQKLLIYLQYRAKRFSTEAAIKKYNSLSQHEKSQLAEDYIREEVLLREARALSLADNDFVIRQRLIQKMEYLSKGFIDESETLTKKQLTNFYTERAENYRRPTKISFSHIFFAHTQQSQEASDAVSQLSLKDKLAAVKTDLNQQKISPSQVNQLGDAFLFHRHYANRSDDVIRSQFGETFVQELADNKANTGTWFGPIQSEHGQHLVYLNVYQASYIPDLVSIEEFVRVDARDFYTVQKTQALINDIVDSYQIASTDNWQQSISVGEMPK